MSDTWTVAGRTFTSRLIVGTGKYKDFEQNAAAVEASGAEIVTVAVRRVNISDPTQPVLMDYIDPKKITYLPNTAGCFNADDAIRTLRLAREAGGWDLVKLEVLGEAKTLYPNMRETLTATVMPVKDKVMVGISGGEYGVRGRMTALNLSDGAVGWRAFSTGPDEEMLVDPEISPLETSIRRVVGLPGTNFPSVGMRATAVPVSSIANGPANSVPPL